MFFICIFIAQDKKPKPKGAVMKKILLSVVLAVGLAWSANVGHSTSSAISTSRINYDNTCPRCGGTGYFIRYETTAWGTFAIYRCMLCGIEFEVRS
jgi:hypothetical protein